MGLVSALPCSLDLSSSVLFHQWRPGFLFSVGVLGGVAAALVVSLLLGCAALVVCILPSGFLCAGV